MSFVIKQTGSFQKLEIFLAKILKDDIYAQLDAYGRQGVNALASATPFDSGLTAASWGYTVERDKRRSSIIWTNTHVVDGTPVVILLTYGHATGTGGYVQGKDFINSALAGVFDEISASVWKAVVSA